MEERDPLLVGTRSIRTASQRSVCAVLKAEFQLRHFGLSHIRSDVFHTPQWRWPQFAFILYRVLASGFAIFTLLWTSLSISNLPTNSTMPHKWYWYLTFWSYIMLTTYLTFAAIVTSYKSASSTYSCYKYAGDQTREESQESTAPRSRERSYTGGFASGSSHEGEDVTVVVETPSNPTEWYLKLKWMLFSMATCMAFLVTIVYFTTLYPFAQSRGRSIDPMDLFLHGLNSVLVFLEIFISAMPVRLLHFVYPLFFGSVYVSFSLILWATDHSIVLYGRLLDWNYPVTTILAVTACAVIVLPLMQLVLFTLYKIRSVIYSKCCT